MEDWQPDETAAVTEGCTNWCNALLWIVRAKIQGTWQMPEGTLTIKQTFQMVSGTLASTPIEGRLHGKDISFTAGAAKYAGRVDGDSMRGTVTGRSGSSWSATRR